MSLKDFTQAYIECSVWSSTDFDGNPLDGLDAELEPDAIARMEADCEDFYRAFSDLWSGQYDHPEYHPDTLAGHDFWLTRNHHGAGFWDRGLGDVGRTLTDMAHAYGEADLYVTDAGTIAHA